MMKLMFSGIIVILVSFVIGCGEEDDGIGWDSYANPYSSGDGSGTQVIVASGVEYKPILGRTPEGIPFVRVVVTNNRDTAICKVSLTVTAYSKTLIDFAFVYFGESQESGRIDPGHSATGIAKFPDLGEIQHVELDGGWRKCVG